MPTHSSFIRPRSCLTYGFLFINGLDSVVSEQDMADSLRIGREFFERPQEEKERLRIREGDGARGYQVLNENVTYGKGQSGG